MSGHAFSDLPPVPAEHFKLYFHAAVTRVIGQTSRLLGALEESFTQFPFLKTYYDELARHGMPTQPGTADIWWEQTIRDWEAAAHIHLPLRALRTRTGLDHSALCLLGRIGLIEEDPRFGLLYEALGVPGQPRMTAGLLSTWGAEGLEAMHARALLRTLQEHGLIQVVNLEAPRAYWGLQPHPVVWDVLRGEVHEQLAPWARYQPAERSPRLSELCLPEPLQEMVSRLPALFEAGDVQTLVVRGPRHNGRRTLLGALARSLGRGMLEVRGLTRPDDERWRLLGPLATVLHAIPVVVLELTPGELAELPSLAGGEGPLGVVLGRQGGVSGPGAEQAISLNVEMPRPAERRVHWKEGFDQQPCPHLEAICDRFRMTAGNIRRAAGLSRSHARLAGRTEIHLSDVHQATRTLNRQALDVLAMRVETGGDWSDLAATPETARELHSLASRCRQREHLHSQVGDALGRQLNPGVRALLKGPSGTGKTLAARLLAASLEMDLYRVDLASVVNKYIGETEKNLSQLFALAEELDVILLLDEGDALLTSRTQVQSSNDRYANLETNYLLQRIETFEGILLVTTNAGDRIDSAFQRRMDVVVDFRPPEAGERWAIWQMHLPAWHAVDSALVRECAARCAMTGGQIRNAVLHASLLALEDGGPITSMHLETAVQREYRKSGSVCPLRDRRHRGVPA